MPRACQYCGEPLQRRANEPANNYKKRRTCNRECGQALARRTRYGDTQAELTHLTETKRCDICGGPMKPYARETVSAFRARVACSRSCGMTRRWRNPNPSSKPAKAARRITARSDREITYSAQVRMPASVRDLGKRREYPRVTPLGEPCPVHPGNTIGAWGKCPACPAGERWAARQRQTVIRPHHEGGR